MPYISQRWPTRDGIIPWKLFYLVYYSLENVLALERINMARAMMDVQSLTGKDQLSGAMDAEIRKAFPWM